MTSKRGWPSSEAAALSPPRTGASSRRSKTSLAPSVSIPAAARRSSSSSLKRAHTEIEDREAKPELGSDRLGLSLELGRAVLRQPDDAAVVAEVVAPKLRSTVKAELTQHRPAEAAHKEVGEDIGTGFFLEQIAHRVGAGEDVVAVKTPQPPDLKALADCVEGAVGAAVGVRDHHQAAL